jgi:hypothetical protein
MQPLSKNIVGEIKKLASVSRSEFPKAYGQWLGRDVSIASMKLGHHLSILVQNGLLEDSGCSLEQLIGHLKVIKGFAKAYVDQDKTLATFIQDVKQALLFITPQRQKLPCRISTEYPENVIALVGIEKSIERGLDAHMYVTDGKLLFSPFIADKLDDATLEYFLKSKAELVNNALFFDFADYPSLTAGAPALIARYCPKIVYSCFNIALADPRFLDHTVVIVGRSIMVNRGILAHFSGYFAKLLESDVGSKLREKAITKHIPYDDEEVDDLIKCITFEDFKDIDLEKAIMLFTMSDYYDCPAMKQQAVAFIKDKISVPVADDELLLHVNLFIQKWRNSLGEMLKMLEPSLFTAVFRSLEEKVLCSLELLPLPCRHHHLDELKCYYFNKELLAMANTPSFPFPPDFKERLRIKKQGANFDKLIKNFDKIVAALGAKEKLEDKRDEKSIDDRMFGLDKEESLEKNVVSSSPSFIDENERYALFQENIAKEIADFQIDFTDEEKEHLFFHFAAEQIKKMRDAGQPIPSDLVKKLRLKERVEEGVNPGLIVNFLPLLRTLDKDNTTDATIPYLIGKIGSRDGIYNHYLGLHLRSNLKRYFTRALEIDPEFAEARQALDALPIDAFPIVEPNYINLRSNRFNEAFGNIRYYNLIIPDFEI